MASPRIAETVGEGSLGHPGDWFLDWCHSMWVGALASPSPSVLYTTSAPPSVPTLCAHAEVPPRKAGTLRIVCLADTHESHARLRVPHGDVLIIAGDMLTLNGRLSLGYSAAKLRRLASWIQAQPHRDKIVIAGNHDSAVERLGAEWMRATFERDGVVYLEDSGTTVAGGLTVWGSPYSRNNHPDRIALFQSPNVAFQSDPERRLGLARRGADILITHGPLLPEDLARLAPRLYVCGHVHELHGVQRSGPTLCVNAATMDKAYQPTHAPVVVDFALGPRGPAVVKAAAGGSGSGGAVLGRKGAQSNLTAAPRADPFGGGGKVVVRIGSTMKV